MTTQAAVTLAILIATVLLLASRRLRPDLTALCASLALILSGVLSPTEAFGAFGQQVIVVVACIYVLGAALYETGVATLIANRLVQVSSRGLAAMILVSMLVAGLLSSVLSSMLVVMILMPAILRISQRSRLAPSQLLLPLTMGAAMGNLLTLIGTISNLVASDLLAASGHQALGFFSLAPFGLLSLALAVGWFLLVGRRLLRRETPDEPQQPSLEKVEEDYRLRQRLYRLRIRSLSDLIGERLEDTNLTDFRLNVLAVQPQGAGLKLIPAGRPLEQNDVLVVEGSRGNILQVANLHGLEPKGTMALEEFNQIEQDTLRLAELMIPFRSRLVKTTLAEARFRERYSLNVLAVRRGGRAIREGLPGLRLKAGDTLLVQGPVRQSLRPGRNPNLVLATHLGPQAGDLITSKARLTIGILLVMIVAVVSGLVPLAPASLAAAIALVLTGCISPDRAYHSIHGNIIVLIGGMLPLALALEKTGAAGLIAGQLARLSPTVGSLGSLLLLYLFAMAMTQIVSNSAAAALVTPIAINLATAQGLSPHLFVMAMAVAVTTSYLTPLTNTDNLLIREAGSYAMRDYVINGLPLILLQTGVVLLILWIAGVR